MVRPPSPGTGRRREEALFSPANQPPATEFDLATTAVGFVLLVVIGVAVTWMAPVAQTTVSMMVLPSLVIFGLRALAPGVEHGEYRARAGR